MRRPILCFLLLFVSTIPTYAHKVIGDLDLTSGQWALVGIPVHNYRMLPIQRSLSTFITKDVSFIQEVQRRWDLEKTFDDKCDYHYELKLYRNGHLQRTLKVNLHCGYITVDGLSYTFSPSEFERFRKFAKPIDWSRISFGDIGMLKRAIKALDTSPGVYWYDDVKQYYYSGFFLVSVNGLYWDSDLDSLYQAVHTEVRRTVRSDNFYLQKYYHTVRGDRMFVRYIVNCEPPLASRYNRSNKYMDWRSHLEGKDSVRVVAIGVDRKRYWQLVDPDQ